MDGKTALVVGAGGLALIAFIARQRAEGQGEATSPFAAGGDSGGFGSWEPAAGGTMGPDNPFGAAAAGPGGVGGAGFYGDPVGPATPYSPAFERDAIAIARKDAKDAHRARVRDNAIQAVGVAAFAAPVVVAGGLGLARGLTALRASPGVTARLAPLARTAVTSTAGSVTLGVGLGLGATAVLEHTGAFDALARQAQRVNAPAPVVTAVKSAALPVAIVGGTAKALVGKDTIAGNLRAAYKGTVQQKVVSSVVSVAKKNAKTGGRDGNRWTPW